MLYLLDVKYNSAFLELLDLICELDTMHQQVSNL